MNTGSSESGASIPERSSAAASYDAASPPCAQNHEDHTPARQVAQLCALDSWQQALEETAALTTPDRLVRTSVASPARFSSAAASEEAASPAVQQYSVHVQESQEVHSPAAAEAAAAAAEATAAGVSVSTPDGYRVNRGVDGLPDAWFWQRGPIQQQQQQQQQPQFRPIHVPAGSPVITNAQIAYGVDSDNNVSSQTVRGQSHFGSSQTEFLQAYPLQAPIPSGRVRGDPCTP